jgi:hypothetical protein
MARRETGPLPSGADGMVIEEIAVFYQRSTHALRTLEKWKLKHGYCIIGISCTNRVVDGPSGGRYGCAHHLANRKAGLVRYSRREHQTAYGKIKQAERERVKKAEAAAEAEREARNAKTAKSIKGRRAA